MRESTRRLGVRAGTALVLAIHALAAPGGTYADPPAQAAQRSTQAAPGKPASEQEALLAEFKSGGTRLVGRRSRTEAAEPDGLTTVEKGSSSAAARKAATAALPIDQLSAPRKERVQEILNNAGYFRRLPTVALAVEPQVYSYFVAHPDVAVSIWRAMNISKLQLWQTARTEYEGDAGDGTQGTLEVLHRGVDKTLVLCEGMYSSTLVSKPLKARSLLLLHTSFIREADGTVYATHRADLFVSFPSQTVEAVSKILSPVTSSLADRTFCEVSMFLKLMSLAMARRPDWVEHISGKLDGIPELRKSQLLLVTANVYSAAQKQALAAEQSDPAQSGPTAIPRTAKKDDRGTLK